MCEKAAAVAAARASLFGAVVAPDVVCRPRKNVVRAPLIIKAVNLILWLVWVSAECDVDMILLLDYLRNNIAFLIAV